MKNIKNISAEISLHVESRLIEKISVAVTLASAPLFKDILLKINSEFAALSDDERNKEISIIF